MPAFRSNLRNLTNAMRNLRRTLLILPLLGAFNAVPAFAAENPANKAVKKEGSFGKAKAAGAYLTRDQLRTCLTRQDKLKTDDAELKNDEGAMSARKAEIVRSGDELKGKLDGIDRTNAEAVAAYNDAVQARDKQIEDFQTRATAFNAHVEANVAAHADFGQSCGNRRYFDEDEIAIKKGK